MPVDASIALGIQPAKFDNPMNTLAQAMQLKGMQQEQGLNALKADEYQRGVSDNKMLNDAYKSAMGADGSIDRTKLYSSMAQGGLGSKLPGVQKGFADTDKAAGEVQKQQLEVALKKTEFASQLLGAAKDQDSYSQVLQAAKQHGLDLSMLPPAYDKALVDRAVQIGLSAKEQLAEKWKALSFTTPDANAVLSAQTSTANNASSNATTRRGQDKADDRARDFNATKVEENNIKRDDKKATADLTKNSQIASFDTMLGTLDRLAAHPGLTRSVGRMGAFPTMPGSNSANFQAELNTFQSQAFLPMVAQLKGMGALSDAEGKKLTAAVGALDPKMGEEAFRASVKRITDDMEAARERMAGARRSGKTGGADAGGTAGGKVVPAAGAVQDGYRFKGGNPADPKSWEKV